MKKYKIAAVLMIVHGGIMEIGGCLCLLPTLFWSNGQFDTSHFFSFIVPYLQENLYLMSAAGLIYGVFRVIGAVGLLKNRLWGLTLSAVNCVLTLALMIFMLPAGLVDGLLAGAALLFILMGYFGNRSITE